MILNNCAHTKYLNDELKYINIINFIFNNIEPQKDMNFRSFHDILGYIEELSYKYEKL